MSELMISILPIMVIVSLGLGKGCSQTEKDLTADTTYYIREHDDGPCLS